MGGIASAIPEMPGGNAGRWTILPLLRDQAGAGGTQSTQAGQRDRHSVQAPGAQETALGGFQESDHHRYDETKTAALEALNRLAGRSLGERYNMTFSDVFEAWKL